MPCSPLSATAEDKPSTDDASASEEMSPVDFKLSVVMDPSAEEKASREMTPHPEEMPSLDEKPSKEGDPLTVAKLSAAAAAKELPEVVKPSAATVAKKLPEPEGVMPSAEERSAEETKLSKTSSPARIRRPSHFLGVPYPTGAARSVVFVSLLYALITPPLVQRVSGQPTALVWTFSHIVTSYFFIGTICLSKMPFYTIFFRFSYGELLSAAATQFIGTDSGTTVATLLTFYAAGMFGHGIAEYLQRQDTAESVNVTVIPSPRAKQYGQPFYDFLGMHGALSCIVAARMVSLVVYPASVLLLIAAKNRENIPLFIVEELALENTVIFAWPWSGFIGLALQEGVAVSLSTMLYKIPACVIAFYLLSSVLSCTVGGVAATLTSWLVAMTMAGFFGYIFAMFARYKILKSLSQDGHYDQKSMVQKMPGEPNKKVEEPNL